MALGLVIVENEAQGLCLDHAVNTLRGVSADFSVVRQHVLNGLLVCEFTNRKGSAGFFVSAVLVLLLGM